MLVYKKKTEQEKKEERKDRKEITSAKIQERERRKYERYMNELVEAVTRIGKNEILLHKFFQDILSSAEYKEIGTRWQIIKQLGRGVTQFQVAENLRVGVATVTRGAHALKDGSGGFRKALKKSRR